MYLFSINGLLIESHLFVTTDHCSNFFVKHTALHIFRAEILLPIQISIFSYENMLIAYMYAVLLMFIIGYLVGQKWIFLWLHSSQKVRYEGCPCCWWCWPGQFNILPRSVHHEMDTAGRHGSFKDRGM